MFSLRSLLALAPLAALALAQNKVAFTSLPATLDVGDSFNITWAGGDGTPVTLTLRQGNPNDLNTVSTIASNVDGYWYNWEVPRTIQDGDDYALQITQGQSDINWTGLFSIEGGASNSTATTTGTSSSMSITSMASASGTGTAMHRNTTFSSASLTSSSEGHFTFGSASTSRTSSGTAATSSSTSAPSNDASAMAGSSAALIMGLVAAMMLH